MQRQPIPCDVAVKRVGIRLPSAADGEGGMHSVSLKPVFPKQNGVADSSQYGPRIPLQRTLLEKADEIIRTFRSPFGSGGGRGFK